MRAQYHFHRCPLSWVIYTSGRCRGRCLGHQQFCYFTNSLFGSYRRRKRERKSKYTIESEKGKHPHRGAVGRRQLLERDDAHEKSPKKAVLATHFCSDILIDNAQQRLEALSISTTLATSPEISEPLSLAIFSKKKCCRCYM